MTIVPGQNANLTREISPKVANRVHSLDPSQAIASGKKIMMTNSRTLAISERDPSLEPPNNQAKNFQLQAAYNNVLGTSGQKFTQQIKKSRAGREVKQANASMEPTISAGPNSSVNLINSPQNWKQPKGAGSFV
jgi:hypothetical protein